MRSKLESENIICFLFDENDLTVGEIKLKINKSDIQKAAEIIDEIEKTPLTNDQGETIKCPKCKSEEIISGFKSMKGSTGILSAIFSFLFFLFPIYYNTVYKCKNCDHEFKYDTKT